MEGIETTFYNENLLLVLMHLNTNFQTSLKKLEKKKTDDHFNKKKFTTIPCNKKKIQIKIIQ